MLRKLDMNWWAWTSFVLLLIGGLNWGLVGLFGFDLVAAIFGELTMLARIVYIVVCLAAVLMIVDAAKSGHARTQPHS
ncbi:hypothetical protein STSP2_01646 [Anaerohalosphaera lusitana]|uniref:DUF378 domain-containing protein n=1 Tax=Anaerohalosphaera lusitana TaxID=1936003 RepID=A0A1U9NKL7_9BACT|nr:DUF378 domain-containing protein [Anaerohalosphaera lusitana]AQT68482.1 hypothetical protein STSP2_01646 [Anaerohalosphaera lusitana]